MNEILSYDGYRWEIVLEDEVYRLYHSDSSVYSTRGGRHMVATVVSSLAENPETAKTEIAEAVIASCWPRMPEAMTDDAFDKMIAEATAE